MALIDQEIVPPKKEQITVRIDPSLLEQLELYCHFIASGQNYVIEQLLAYTFRKDRDFQEWLLKEETTGGKEGVGHKREAVRPGGADAETNR